MRRYGVPPQWGGAVARRHIGTAVAPNKGDLLRARLHLAPLTPTGALQALLLLSPHHADPTVEAVLVRVVLGQPMLCPTVSFEMMQCIIGHPATWRRTTGGAYSPRDDDGSAELADTLGPASQAALSPLHSTLLRATWIPLSALGDGAADGGGHPWLSTAPLRCAVVLAFMHHMPEGTRDAWKHATQVMAPKVLRVYVTAKLTAGADVCPCGDPYYAAWAWTVLRQHLSPSVLTLLEWKELRRALFPAPLGGGAPLSEGGVDAAASHLRSLSHYGCSVPWVSPSDLPSNRRDEDLDEGSFGSALWTLPLAERAMVLYQAVVHNSSRTDRGLKPRALQHTVRLVHRLLVQWAIGGCEVESLPSPVDSGMSPLVRVVGGLMELLSRYPRVGDVMLSAEDTNWLQLMDIAQWYGDRHTHRQRLPAHCTDLVSRLLCHGVRTIMRASGPRPSHHFILVLLSTWQAWLSRLPASCLDRLRCTIQEKGLRTELLHVAHRRTLADRTLLPAAIAAWHDALSPDAECGESLLPLLLTLTHCIRSHSAADGRPVTSDLCFTSGVWLTLLSRGMATLARRGLQHRRLPRPLDFVSGESIAADRRRRMHQPMVPALVAFASFYSGLLRSSKSFPMLPTDTCISLWSHVGSAGPLRELRRSLHALETEVVEYEHLFVSQFLEGCDAVGMDPSCLVRDAEPPRSPHGGTSTESITALKPFMVCVYGVPTTLHDPFLQSAFLRQESSKLSVDQSGGSTLSQLRAAYHTPVRSLRLAGLPYPAATRAWHSAYGLHLFTFSLSEALDAKAPREARRKMHRPPPVCVTHAPTHLSPSLDAYDPMAALWSALGQSFLTFRGALEQAWHADWHRSQNCSASYWMAAGRRGMLRGGTAATLSSWLPFDPSQGVHRLPWESSKAGGSTPSRLPLPPDQAHHLLQVLFCHDPLSTFGLVESATLRALWRAIYAGCGMSHPTSSSSMTASELAELVVWRTAIQLHACVEKLQCQLVNLAAVKKPHPLEGVCPIRVLDHELRVWLGGREDGDEANESLRAASPTFSETLLTTAHAVTFLWKAEDAVRALASASPPDSLWNEEGRQLAEMAAFMASRLQC